MWIKSAGYGCDPAVCGLNYCRAPGLEQEHSLRPLNRGGLHRHDGTCSGLGRANVDRSAALKSQPSRSVQRLVLRNLNDVA